MKHYLCAPALLLSLTACRVDFDGGDGPGQFQENFHGNFKVDASARLSLDNENGGVEISSWDKNEVEVNAVKFASSEAQLKDVKIEASATPGLISLRTIRQRTLHGNSGARYTIRVPKHMTLDRIHSTNGSITVEGVAAPVLLESTNGALHFARIEGKMEGRTTNGSIELTSCVGDARVNSTNGKIEGDVERGVVDAKTSNGEITLKISKALGAVRATTSNGDIDLTLDEGHELRASTSNSAITVRLPAGANAELRARTSHSSVRSDFDVSRTTGGDSSEEREHKSLAGQIGSGGPLMDLSTSNGSIRLIKR